MVCLPTQRQRSQQPTQRQQRCLPGPLTPKLEWRLPGLPVHGSGAMGSLGSGQLRRHGLGALGSGVAEQLGSRVVSSWAAEWHDV